MNSLRAIYLLISECFNSNKRIHSEEKKSWRLKIQHWLDLEILLFSNKLHLLDKTTLITLILGLKCINLKNQRINTVLKKSKIVLVS